MPMQHKSTFARSLMKLRSFFCKNPIFLKQFAAFLGDTYPFAKK